MLNITVSILVNILILDGKCRSSFEEGMMHEGITYECRLNRGTNIVAVDLSGANQNGTVYLRNKGAFLSNIDEYHDSDYQNFDDHYDDDEDGGDDEDIDNREGELVLGILKEIHLDFKSIRIEADVLPRLENLKELRIVEANFENDKTFLSGLENLKNLQLDHLPMVAIPEGFFDNQQQLHSLIYTNGGLQVLGNGNFKNLSSLKALELDRNQLVDISSDVFRALTRLERLQLCCNKLRILPPNLLANLTNLQLVNLSNNEFQTLPAELFVDNVALKSLYLYHNQLVNIPSELFKSQTHLDYLNIGDNKLTSLPPKLLLEVSDLHHLVLSGNELNTIPDGFFERKSKLQYLRINNNQLVNITTESLAGARLINLFLQNNRLSTLPDNLLSSHPLLMKLDLSHNMLQSLPATFFNNNSYLREFIATDNRITDLPRSFFPLSMRELFLDNNLLQIFPLNDAFNSPWDDENPLRIERVSLKNNSISTFITSNLSLLRLYLLDVSHNNLTVLSSLHWLEAPDASIDFSHNQITHIICDDCRYHFSRLDLNNNPIVCDFQLIDLLKETKLKDKIKIVEGTCAEPAMYKGVEISRFKKLPVPSAAGCPEECDCDSMVLQIHQVEVYCTGRQLTQLPEISQLSKKFKKLIVTASHNQITLITPSSLRGYENVTMLNVSHNRLEQIVASNLEKLEYIDISANKLHDLNSIAQFMNRSAIDIRAAENPWICNCEAAINLFALMKPNVTINDIAQVSCSTGEQLSPVLFRHVCQDHKMVMLVVTLFTVILVVVVTSFTVYILRNQIKSWFTGQAMNSSDRMSSTLVENEVPASYF